MTWARIDDNFPNHPKVVAAGPICELIHVRAICYCNRYLTDGFFPAAAVSQFTSGLDQVALTPGRAAMRQAGAVAARGWDADEVDWASRMVAGGFWSVKQKGGVVGYEVHDFLDYNLSRREVVQLRENKRVAGRIGGVRSAERRAAAQAPAEAPAEADIQQLPKQKRTPVPVTRTQKKKDSLTPAELANDFERFYADYPRHTAPDRARRAYANARKQGAPHDAIMAGLKRQLPELMAREPKFIPHPATWLNAGQWRDEITLDASALSRPPRDILRDEWFNPCDQGALGECVKTEFLSQAPEWARRQCPEHAAR